jgi:hypothetical protein
VTLYAPNEINTIHISIDHFATFHLLFCRHRQQIQDLHCLPGYQFCQSRFTSASHHFNYSVCITSHTYSGRLCLFQFPSALLLIFLHGITKARFVPLFTGDLANSATSPEKVPVTTDFPQISSKKYFSCESGKNQKHTLRKQGSISKKTKKEKL